MPYTRRSFVRNAAAPMGQQPLPPPPVGHLPLETGITPQLNYPFNQEMMQTANPQTMPMNSMAPVPPMYNPMMQLNPMMQVNPTMPALPMNMPVIPWTNPVMPMSNPVMPWTNPVMPMINPVMPMGNPVMPSMPMGNPVMPSMPMNMPIIPATNPMMPIPYESMENGNMWYAPGSNVLPGQIEEPADAEIDAVSRQGDPPPILSNNPAVPSIVLFKQLTGYPNYGNPSGNADILYTGNTGIWTFTLPPVFFIQTGMRGQLVIRAVLDDHASVPVSRYSAHITVNGSVVHNGPVPLEHGVPAGGRFTNWRDLTFMIPVLRRNNRIVIVNTSNTGNDDWIAFDWMELRLVTR